MAHHRHISTPEAWATDAAALVAAAITEVVRSQGRCHLVLAGGGTPLPVYDVLATLDLPWSDVEIWFGDERCVAPGHPDSNYLAARAHLIDRIEPGAIHRIEAERDDRDAVAADYAAKLPQPLDVVLLGMGGDGHTASIFPGQSPEGRVAVVNGPKPPPWRITLTADAFAGARHTFVLVNGSGKAERVAEALTTPPGTLPIQLASEGTWILDTDAAGALED